jgi:hypothetical protein
MLSYTYEAWINSLGRSHMDQLDVASRSLSQNLEEYKAYSAAKTLADQYHSYTAAKTLANQYHSHTAAEALAVQCHSYSVAKTRIDQYHSYSAARTLVNQYTESFIEQYEARSFTTSALRWYEFLCPRRKQQRVSEQSSQWLRSRTVRRFSRNVFAIANRPNAFDKDLRKKIGEFFRRFVSSALKARSKVERCLNRPECLIYFMMKLLPRSEEEANNLITKEVATLALTPFEGSKIYEEDSTDRRRRALDRCY